MFELYLVRHGLVDKTKPNYPLNKRGKLFADYLVDFFENISLDGIISSNHPRCINTVNPVSQSQGIDILEVNDLEFLNNKPLALAKREKGKILLCFRIQYINPTLMQLGQDTFDQKNRDLSYGRIYHYTVLENLQVEAKHTYTTEFVRI